MASISLLPKEVIAHIAAGQVVERPASIVKELVENALDAQAQNISVRVSEGGKKKIVITDDGIGMTAKDVTLAVQPHTTSKIASVADLYALTSFGFRGEALSSIGKSARLTLQSKTKNEELGTKIIINACNVEEESQVGMDQGTQIIVEQLFWEIPARKKFLKSAQTEFHYILEVVTELALAHPAVGFQLFHNQTLVCDYLPQQELHTRIQAVLGDAITAHFLPLHFEIGSYEVHGFIGTPQAATQVSQRQILLVNQRPVTSLPISKTIKKLFGNLLPPTVHPPFVLFVSTSPDLIDVNIHPRKEKVAFTEQDLVLDILSQAIKKTLHDADLTFQFSTEPTYLLQDSGMDVETAKILRRNVVEPWNVKNYFAEEPILQIKKLYLVAQTKNGVVLIDQHAAHERILYEEFLAAFESEQLKKQQVILSKPEKITLPILEAELLSDNQNFFNELGFVFERKKPLEFVFSTVPALLKTRKIAEYLLEVLQDIDQELPVRDVDYQSHKTIAYLACRTAIKAGEVLRQDERKNILQKLAETKSNYTCPHGRPVLVTITGRELEQLFHRIPASRKE